MKDAIEYLAIVVIAVVVGSWALQGELGEPMMEFLNQTARMIITGGVAQ